MKFAPNICGVAPQIKSQMTGRVDLESFARRSRLRIRNVIRNSGARQLSPGAASSRGPKSETEPQLPNRIYATWRSESTPCDNGAIFAIPGDIRGVAPGLYLRRKGAATNDWQSMRIVVARKPGCISSADRGRGLTVEGRRRRAGEGYPRRRDRSLFPDGQALRLSTAGSKTIGPGPGI